MHAKLLQSCLTLWTVGHQAPLSVGFSRQEYWSGLPCPPPGIFPTQGSNPHLFFFFFMSPAGGLFTTSATWEAQDPSLQRIYSTSHSVFKSSQNHIYPTYIVPHHSRVLPLTWWPAGGDGLVLTYLLKASGLKVFLASLSWSGRRC